MFSFEPTCLWCDADCWTDQEHSYDCPTKTGLWPVRPNDLIPWGLACCECHSEFQIGDYYVLRDSITGFIEVQPEIGDILCVGCGALSEVGLLGY